ncbi:M56 family metallopeptidase [Flavobacterium sp. MFBS3-15]|uniref:M56 family metallopeptidase n=1 Tax=Flavobacterium sp. MFBS3-15 TaxID=2989816 RepID=UPI002235BFE9|nr:M56 family metallopeptidase [Flavobacterium sp. MFBS3-15]MCW4468261.1 M56 family metallopeptidase [Flavobacterium sp. MFBS3-15]
MSHFLITSTISMAALLGLYHLLLEREKMHRFNRFYLLASVVFSLVLPFLTIEVYTEAVTESMPVMENLPYAPVAFAAPVVEETDYLSYIILGIYILVAIVLILRFKVNISRMMVKIRSNEIIPYKNARLVLVEEEILPHTFLNCIFINKEGYSLRAIEPELFTHELVHVNQKHTLDVLFIEMLKVVFWFNPALYFYKKAMQLNHEFLADEVVVAGADVAGYQMLLLQKAHPATLYPLASSLNFSITKKRFTMMTKATTQSKALMLKLSAVPVITGLIALLCIETVAQEKPVSKESVQVMLDARQTNNERRDAYYKGVRVIIDDKANDVRIDKVFENLTEEQKQKYHFYAPEAYMIKHPTKEEYERFKDKKGYALQIDGKEVDNAILNKYKPEDFAYYSGYTMSRKALTKEKPQIFRYQLYTPEYFEKHLKGSNDHYPGDTFTMIITKEFKDDKVVADRKIVKGGDWEDVEFYLKQDIPYNPADLDEQPEFPGGMTGFFTVIAKNFKVPDVEEINALKIYVSFIVEKEGTMSNIKILRDPASGMGQEAERVLKAIAEKWKPGMKKGKPVRTLFNLPIVIKK